LLLFFVLCNNIYSLAGHWNQEKKKKKLPVGNSQIGHARRFEWIRFHPRAVIPQYNRSVGLLQKFLIAILHHAADI
jgi:hypothetical protein